VATPSVQILSRQKSGQAYTIVGLVQGKRIMVDVPADQIEGLSEPDAENRMRRSLLSCARYLETQADGRHGQG
jgi:hypothetical protein